MMHRQPHILIVDDDGFVRNSIELIAKQLGYKSTLAKNGREALALAQEQIFDLIISDLYMPEMDGNELIVSIKSMPEYKNIPFLFLSGSNERHTWVKNLNAGADDFITKPYDKRILALKLRSQIKKHFLRKELLKSNMEYNISLSEGMIVYCTGKNSKYKLNPNLLSTKLKVVYSTKELFETTENLKIWLLIVDYDAIDEFDINKIKLTSDLDFSTVLIANNLDEVSSQIDNGMSNFILKTLPEKLFYHQINSLIERETEVKSKYINAIKLAVDNSPIRFERKTELDFENYHIAVKHEPYEHIPGGDFYEILSNPDNDIKIIVLGDVMGKKWGAWFFVNAYVAYIRSTIHFLLHNTPSSEMTASGIIELLNKQISHDLQIAEVFTTLTIIIIRKNKPLNVSTAGAMKPLMFKAKNQDISSLNITGMLLGISEGSKYHQLELELEPNDKILFYSDGYTEITDSKTKEMLSTKSVIKVFQKLGKDNILDLDLFEKTLIKDFNITAFDDDRSMLVISRI